MKQQRPRLALTALITISDDKSGVAVEAIMDALTAVGNMPAVMDVAVVLDEINKQPGGDHNGIN